MQARQLVSILLVVVAVLGVIGWQRYQRAQSDAALRNLSPAAGITMVHFYADW